MAFPPWIAETTRGAAAPIDERAPASGCLRFYNTLIVVLQYLVRTQIPIL